MATAIMVETEEFSYLFCYSETLSEYEARLRANAEPEMEVHMDKWVQYIVEYSK